MRLDPDLLDGPAPAGARVIALARVADAEEAVARLADPHDQAALHDLRVALRRLRTTLKALAPLLGGAADGKPGKRLQKAARRTGPARDLEVFQAWLHGARDGLPAPWRGAHAWLEERVERRLAQAVAEVHAGAAPRVRRAAVTLARRLAEPPPAAPGAAATLAAALAPLLRAQAVALRTAARDVAGASDVAALHGVRLQAKRLRYLLEPLRGLEGADAGPAVAALRGLQDALGEWHDAQVARRLLGAGQTEAAADRARWLGRGGDADLRPGLLGLDRLAGGRADAAWARLEAEHLGAPLTALLDQAYAVVAGLEARAAPPGEAAGPEVRLLLLGLPQELGATWVDEVEQGWLPGERGHEGVCLVRTGGEAQHVRLRAGGAGPLTATPLGRADFEALWPLTEGRRLRRRSHRSAVAPGWRFDEYLDRRLVMAIRERDAGDAPPWLEPLVVRDVTGEKGYADDALARRPRKKAADDGPAGPG